MITLQFSTQRNVFAGLVKWFTWSPYSHVDFVLPDGRLLGARFFGGVKIREPEQFSKVERFTVEAPAEVLDLAGSQIGQPYDWTGILGILARSNWQDSRGWFCSELIAWAFHAAGHPLLRSHKMHRITPRDLLLSPLLKPAQ